MVKLVILLCSTVLLFHKIGADDCPELGVKGYSRLFPVLLSNGEGQKVGYHAEIGVFGQNKVINDRFDGLTGKLVITSQSGSSEAYYYPSTDEAFIIKNGECDSLELGSNRKKIVDLWSSSDLSTILNISESLGPTGLLVSFISQQKDKQLLQLMVKDNVTGFDDNSITNKSTNWFTCLPSKGPAIDVFLDDSRRLKTMILKIDDKTRIPFSFIQLNPLSSDQQEPLTYPYGHGCIRRVPTADDIPTFTESYSFKLRMEIALHYDGKPNPEFLDTLSLVRYQGIYSYDSLYDNQKVRVIYDPDLSIEYLIYQDSEVCSTSTAILLHSGYLKWPYTNDSAFNVLAPMVLQLRKDDMTYFGQIRSDSKLLDIYERKITPFTITDGQYRSALINYFIPVESTSDYRAPSQIDIQLENSPTKSGSVTRIKLKILEYVESDDLYDPVLFDLRSCQNEFGSSSWFQIVFSIVPTWILKIDNRQEILESAVRKVLDFIPMNRLSDIRVGIRGPSLYITSKLSDGPSILYAYEASSNTILTNSRTELIRDNEEDCGRLCTTNSNCKAFSYCDDRKCSFYTGPLPVTTNQTPKRCTVYTSKFDHFNDSRDSTEAKLNHFTSSSLLMNQIKLMVDKRKFALPDVGIADKMFVVSSPYEIGGYGDAYEYDHSMTSKLNDYKLLLSGYELVETKRNERLTGLNYLDCLYKCENDDDCLTVSYCNDGNGGCTVSSQSAETIKLNDELKSLKSSCTIMSKTFIDFFNRLPGRSLIRSEAAPRKLVNLDRYTCAKACLDEQSFTCEAFDFCESDNPKSFDCFLRVFHIFGNASDESYSWNSSNTRCDHYTRKLSMDYKQFVGMKLIESPMIATIGDNSLENCASACNRAKEGCESFEYCQPFDSTQVTSSCRLTSRKVIGDLSNMTAKASCSVYGINRSERVNRVYLLRGRVSMPLAILGGLCAFMFGVLLSASITYYSTRRNKY